MSDRRTLHRSLMLPARRSGSPSRSSRRSDPMRLLPCLAALLLSVPAFAADWPQWLGPNRDGSSPEVVKPWKGDPKVVWRAAVGEGHSSPVVAAGRVYVHFRTNDKNE